MCVGGIGFLTIPLAAVYIELGTMRVMREFELAVRSAKAVAFTWIGACLFPFAHVMPIANAMFWICLGGGALSAMSFVGGIRAWRQRRLSDVIVLAVVPLVLMAASTLLVVRRI